MNECSISKENWFPYLFNMYNIKEGMRILKIGCGNCKLWKDNIDRIPEGCEIIATDVSRGMYEKESNYLVKKGINFQTMAIEEINFDSGHFDLVIANHMLYHAIDLQKGLNEVSRVLTSGGKFFSATISGNNNVYIVKLIKDFTLPIEYSPHKIAEKFGQDNGIAISESFFSEVKQIEI